MIIRNDNGAQFLANQVRAFLVQLEAQQEFTHVATPEENAYIEAFHSILQRELIERYEFSSFYEANQHIEKCMQWYNYERKHRSWEESHRSRNGSRAFPVHLISRAARWMWKVCQGRMIP